jgi:hypothetical protein
LVSFSVTKRNLPSGLKASEAAPLLAVLRKRIDLWIGVSSPA